MRYKKFFSFKTFPALAMVLEFPAVSHTRYDFWKEKQYTQSGMWWFTLIFGFLGLHHYMLRSPQTGMIFFLTNILLCGYPWFYDLIQLSSYGNTTEELNEFGLGHPWGPLGMAQGMWKGEEKDNHTAASAVASAAVAAATQMGGGEEEKEKEEPPEYVAPNPLMFVLYNLCVPLSPLAHLIGGNRERALTRFLYLFSGILFIIIFTIIFGILWLFLPSSLSGLIYSIYPPALTLVSCIYIFAVLYDYIIMAADPSTLFFNSKECNLNGFVGFNEDPPCPSTQSPMAVVATVFKPLTDIIYSIYNYVYKTGRGIAITLIEMTPQGASIRIARELGEAAERTSQRVYKEATKIAEESKPMMIYAIDAMAGRPAPGAPGVGVPGVPPGVGVPGVGVPGVSVPSIPSVPAMPKVPSMPIQKGGGNLDPLDYLGAGVIGAILTGGFILGAVRNVKREQWLDDTPPNPRGV